jgi:hypothetical protein
MYEVYLYVLSAHAAQFLQFINSKIFAQQSALSSLGDES